MLCLLFLSHFTACIEPAVEFVPWRGYIPKINAFNHGLESKTDAFQARIWIHRVPMVSIIFPFLSLPILQTWSTATIDYNVFKTNS